MNPCPTCGGLKKDHTGNTWKVHQEMYKNYMKAQKDFITYAKRAVKKAKKK